LESENKPIAALDLGPSQDYRHPRMAFRPQQNLAHLIHQLEARVRLEFGLIFHFLMRYLISGKIKIGKNLKPFFHLTKLFGMKEK